MPKPNENQSFLAHKCRQGNTDSRLFPRSSFRTHVLLTPDGDVGQTGLGVRPRDIYTSFSKHILLLFC